MDGRSKIERIAGVVAWVLIATPVAVPAQHLEVRDLGGHPLCEASAALTVPCPHPGEACLLVGDNEEREHLFLYRLGANGPEVASRQMLSFAHLLDELPADEREISDIEALVGLEGSDVLIVASHSRSKACKSRKKRRRMLGATLGRAGLSAHPSWAVEQAKKPSCKRLFGHERDDLSGQPRAVCTAIEKAREAGDEAEGDAVACERAAPMNVEGAVAVPSTTGATRVWLGLRTPQVEGKAVLVRRTAPGTDPAFDATALIDLARFGVRDLTVHWGWVWLIAGPPEDDATAEFQLARFPVEALAPNAVIRPERVRALPNGAEGLAFHGANAVVVMDGDEADGDATVCGRDATYTVLPVSLGRS